MGLTFSIGDSAAGYAALTTLALALDMEVVTAEIKINLLAPARGDPLIAIGKVVKPAKRLCVVTAEVLARTDTSDTLIAVLQGTMNGTGPRLDHAKHLHHRVKKFC